MEPDTHLSMTAFTVESPVVNSASTMCSGLMYLCPSCLDFCTCKHYVLSTPLVSTCRDCLDKIKSIDHAEKDRIDDFKLYLGESSKAAWLLLLKCDQVD